MEVSTSPKGHCLLVVGNRQQARRQLLRSSHGSESIVAAGLPLIVCIAMCLMLRCDVPQELPMQRSHCCHIHLHGRPSSRAYVADIVACLCCTTPNRR
jgi:hypothetical protein